MSFCKVFRDVRKSGKVLFMVGQHGGLNCGELQSLDIEN